VAVHEDALAMLHEVFLEPLVLVADQFSRILLRLTDSHTDKLSQTMFVGYLVKMAESFSSWSFWGVTEQIPV
jgi:hypothetical protein